MYPGPAASRYRSYIRGKELSPAGRSRVLQNEAVPCRTKQCPSRRTRAPQYESGSGRTNQRTKVPQDGSGPRGTRQDPAERIGPFMTNQGPAGRIRAPQNDSGPRGRISAPRNESGSEEHIRTAMDEPGSRKTNQVLRRIINQGPSKTNQGTRTIAVPIRMVCGPSTILPEGSC